MTPPNKKHKKQKTNPLPDAGSDFVTITIPSGQKFAAHAHMLAHHSEYFRRALHSQFQEATTRTFDLSVHATEATVSSFVKWIYQQSDKFPDSPFDAQALFDGLSDRDAVESWLFGDYIQATGFRNDLILFMFFNQHFDYRVVVDTWDLLNPERKLRSFLVSQFCSVVTGRHDVDKLLESLPPTLVLEASKWLFKRLKEEQSPRRDKLEFNIYDHLEEM
ncbi:hypothetical protein F5Y06DRAFT_192685 [Hypoxylon sp. FL0890]|nr:hypothetical protein F5Y06DRAFT_192685 [Hypoxylon sp. FL0890]